MICLFVYIPCRYIEDDDGYYKLQMSRYECLDIQEQKKIKLIAPKNVIVKKKSQTVSNVSSCVSLVKILLIIDFWNIFIW